MKKIVAVLTLCLWAGIAAFAQKNITISGTISNPTDQKLIVVNVSNTNILPENKQEVVPIGADGKFSVSIPVTEKYNWIIFVNSNQRMDFYAKEGSELTFNATAHKLDSTSVFTGKDSEIPQYFAELGKKRGGIKTYYDRTQQVAVNDPASYRHALDSVKADEEAFMKNSAEGKALPKDFQAYWSTLLQYSVYDAMLNYPAVHEQIRLQTNSIQNIPKELYVVTRSIPAVFNDDNLDMPFYQTYVQSYYGAQLAAAGFINIIMQDPKTLAQDRSKALQQTDSMLRLIYKNMPKKTAEFAAGRIIATESKFWPVEELEVRSIAYKKQFPKSANNAILERLVYNKRKFDPGQPEVDFAFTTIDGKKMKLSDLKGKVVYMDFWASWCGPCKGEMPHAKKVKEHFKDRQDVVFLYVSIDDKEDAWKRGIEAMSISGMHTRTPGWKGEIATLYDIESVPAYFLIDKKGNFVTKKTPRPSQTDEVIKLIDGLL